MIPSSAVNKYLERELDSHLWVKELTAAELDPELIELGVPPRIVKTMRLHQKACFLLGIAYPQFCFWLDMGCVDSETEYLTPTGWKKISDYASGEVGQYNPATREVTFVKPEQFVKRPCNNMAYFKTARGVDQMLSLEHNMLVVATGKKESPKSHPVSWKHTPVAPLAEYRSRSQPNPWLYRVSAAEMLAIQGQRHASIETTFKHSGEGIDLTEAQIRVQVAVHADGYLPLKAQKVVVRVKKARKKARMRLLLKQAGIPYVEREAGRGYTSFRFVPPHKTKTYGELWWRCSYAQKLAVANEVGYWNGSISSKTGSITFFSRSRLCAEFIQFCFASTRRRAYINVSAKVSRDGSGRTDYVVHAIGKGRTTNLANLLGGRLVPSTDGFKYCFEVPTGYLVLRRGGNIFVTGNTGKTYLALALLRYWHRKGKIRRALVFVKSDKAYRTWLKQVERFQIDLPVYALPTSSKEKWKALDEITEGLALLPYPGATALVSTVVPKKWRAKKVAGVWTVYDKKRKLLGEVEGAPSAQAAIQTVAEAFDQQGEEYDVEWALDKSKVDKLAAWSDGFVLDESTAAGNHSSLVYQLIECLGETAQVRYALAGRPFGRDPTMLFNQHRLIDGGVTLGSTLGMFRAAFFSEEKDFWSKNRHAKKYKFKKSTKAELSRMVQHRSITYAADECIELPPVTPIEEFVPFSDEAEAYFERARRELREARGNFREVKNAFLRMRQISSGFMGFKNDDTGEKAEIEFEENPKLDRLIELLEELPEGRKAVVFHDFTFSGRRIVERIKKELKTKPIWLWSGTKDPAEEQRRFEEDEECLCAVINNKVGAYSLDGLQYVANYTFFYESPVAVIDREQAERRLERDGQRRKVFRYDLLMRNTMDERILEFHAEGADLFDALLRNPAKVLSR